MSETVVTSPTVLLTGPTSGIGAAMLDALVAHPARPRLVLVARDAAALDRAIARARGHGLVADGIVADLGDLASVRAALDELAVAVSTGRIPTIDVALLNAGTQFASRGNTGAQGHELTFTINVIAQHLLLRGIEPLLSLDGHAVLMGSSTHRGRKASFYLVPDPLWEEPGAMAAPQSSSTWPTAADERRQGGVAYATSKLALVTLSHDWAARLGGSGRRLNVYDPGLVAGTGLGKDMPRHRYWVWKYLMPAMSLLPGATTVGVAGRRAVELALGDAHPTLRDGYVQGGTLARPEPVTFDEARRRELWGWLESEVADWLPGIAAVT